MRILLNNFWTCLFVAAVLGFLCTAQKDDLFISNMDEQCLRCLCYTATNCNLTLGCISGYCGAFKLAKVYWVDAGKPLLSQDTEESALAFQDCAFNYKCASKAVTNYMAKYGKDCNNDGVTNCEDYMMINFNGAFQCGNVLNNSDMGKAWLERFSACMPIVS